MKRRQFSFSAVSAASLAGASALPSLALFTPLAAQAALGEIKVGLDDYSKRFLQFYETATTAVAPPQANASEPAQPARVPTDDERWALYKKVYEDNPRNLSDAKWREEFNAAWPKYASVLDIARGGFNALKPAPADMIGTIGGALRMEQSLALTFICYVGTFSGQVVSGMKPTKTLTPEGNSLESNKPFIAFELETYANGGDKKVALAMADLCMLTTGQSRTQQDISASSIIYNGVYMHLARVGLGLSSVEPLFATVGITAEQRTPEALRAMRNKLQAPATSASEAETLYAGAQVVDRWLGRGLSFSEILRTPKDQVAKVTGAVLDTIIKK